MAHIFNMPQLGSTMEEGTILKWHKQEGDTVRQGETLLEIETDKATMEVESEVSGVVRKILAKNDALIAIRTPIAIIGDAEEPIEHLLGEAGAGGASAANGAAVAPLKPTSDLLSKDLPDASPKREQEKILISPRARRYADEHGVPLAALAGRGSGPQGRIVERDVEAFLQQPSSRPVAAAETASPIRATPLASRMAEDLGVNLKDLALGLPGSRVRSEDVLRHAETERPADLGSEVMPDSTNETTIVAYGGMRKRIADNVVKSAFTAPHVTLTLEVDMTSCAAFRSQIMPDIEKTHGVRISYNDILIKAAAKALGEHPRLNASLANDEIRLYADKNIGVAVALEEGLIVPVVKNSEQKSLGSISAELKQLVERSRTGKFTPDDLSGGTFTITNLGAFGIDIFDPIIVTGQAAILGVGRIADKPIVVKKEIVIRSMMNLCLSFDHRILDGAPAARFLQRIKELLENPVLVLI